MSTMSTVSTVSTMSTVSTVSTGSTVSTVSTVSPVSTVIARCYLHLRWYFLSVTQLLTSWIQEMLAHLKSAYPRIDTKESNSYEELVQVGEDVPLVGKDGGKVAVEVDDKRGYKHC